MSDKIITLTDARFKEEVLESKLPVFVDFWAPWCGPCRMVAPIVEELGEEYSGRVKFGKLNVDDNPVTAQKYGIVSIPTLMIFKNGEVAEQLIGAHPKKRIKQAIDEVLASS